VTMKTENGTKMSPQMSILRRNLMLKWMMVD